MHRGYIYRLSGGVQGSRNKNKKIEMDAHRKLHSSIKFSLKFKIFIRGKRQPRRVICAS